MRVKRGGGGDHTGLLFTDLRGLREGRIRQGYEGEGIRRVKRGNQAGIRQGYGGIREKSGRAKRGWGTGRFKRASQFYIYIPPHLPAAPANC